MPYSILSCIIWAAFCAVCWHPVTVISAVIAMAAPCSLPQRLNFPLKERASVFSFVTLVFWSAPPPFLQANYFSIFFKLIANLKFVKNMFQVVFVETQRSGNRLRSPEHLLCALFFILNNTRTHCQFFCILNTQHRHNSLLSSINVTRCHRVWIAATCYIIEKSVLLF